jgi:phage-related protein
MAYNPFIYNRDNSIDSKYSYVLDLSVYKPLYGSSVSYQANTKFMSTIDNSLKLYPSTENNITAKYNLKFLLKDQDVGNLLETIEVASGTKILNFKDPSGMYSDFAGLVEDYSLEKADQNYTKIDLVITSYFKSVLLNWSKSSFLNNISKSNNLFNQAKSYLKYETIYYEDLSTSNNKVDNFWIAKQDIIANTNFSLNNFTKSFIYDTKLPFSLKNNIDVHKFEYKNSLVKNINYKINSNSIKSLPLTFDNIDDNQCISMLFFLEKRAGYRKFIYEFPIYFNKNKIFICTSWTHTFKYKNCNTLTLNLIEDPVPNSGDILEIDGYYFIKGN